MALETSPKAYAEAQPAPTRPDATRFSQGVEAPHDATRRSSPAPPPRAERAEGASPRGHPVPAPAASRAYAGKLVTIGQVRAATYEAQG